MKLTPRAKAFSIVVLLLLFLVACSSSSPTDTPKPTDTPRPTWNPPTAPPKPTATPTRTPTPTLTPFPIYTTTRATTWFYGTGGVADCATFKRSRREIAENTRLQITGESITCPDAGILIECNAPENLNSAEGTIWIPTALLVDPDEYTPAPTQTLSESSALTPRPTSTSRPSSTPAPLPMYRVIDQPFWYAPDENWQDCDSFTMGRGKATGLGQVQGTGRSITCVDFIAGNDVVLVEIRARASAGLPKEFIWLFSDDLHYMGEYTPKPTSEYPTFTPRPTATLAPTSISPTQPPPPTAVPTEPPPPSPTEPPSAVCDCSGNIYNCSDFSTHNQAQACYNYCMQVVGYDVHGLDGSNNDGLACESLP